MLSGVYYGLSVNATSLGGNPFITLTISGLLEVPAELLAGILFMKIGRRWSMFIFNILGRVWHIYFFSQKNAFKMPNYISKQSVFDFFEKIIIR